MLNLSKTRYITCDFRVAVKALICPVLNESPCPTNTNRLLRTLADVNLNQRQILNLTVSSPSAILRTERVTRAKNRRSDYFASLESGYSERYARNA